MREVSETPSSGPSFLLPAIYRQAQPTSALLGALGSKTTLRCLLYGEEILLKTSRTATHLLKTIPLGRLAGSLRLQMFFKQFDPTYKSEDSDGSSSKVQVCTGNAGNAAFVSGLPGCPICD